MGEDNRIDMNYAFGVRIFGLINWYQGGEKGSATVL